MTKRKQNLFLFFEENEDYNVINSRLVRLYMNRFTIDETEETEITGIGTIQNKTWEDYEKCFSKALKMANEKVTPNTDMHLILGNSSIIEEETFKYDTEYRWLKHDSLVFKLSQLIAIHRFV